MIAFGRSLPLVLALTATAGCADQNPAAPTTAGTEATSPTSQSAEPSPTSQSAEPANLAGPWEWTHSTVFVLPAGVAAAVLPPQGAAHVTGPVAHIDCTVSGTMFITQSGSTFSGTATQSSSCRVRTGGPAFAWPFVYQPAFNVDDGRVMGHAFQFKVLPLCQNRGAARVAGGVTVSWRATGKCDPPIPDHPAVGKTKTWEAWRPSS